MQAAWESMQALSEDLAYRDYLNCSYDAPTDTLSIQVYSKVDPDVLFDELDKSVKGADLGNLVLDLFSASYEDDYLEKFSARLGKLRCKSIRCLAFGDHMVLPDDAWTALLDRTEILYNPPLKHMTDYSETGMTNLAQVKKLWITDTASSSLQHVSVLPGLEEIAISAGLTAGEQEKTREALEQAYQISYSNESDIYHGILFFHPAEDLKSLKRILYYPELDSWKPDTQYCMNIFSMQLYIPKVYTNVPGEIWSGDENTISFIIPSWDLESINENKIDENEDIKSIELRDKLYLEEANNNAIINAYKLSNSNITIKESSYKVIYISPKANTDIKVGDKLISVNGVSINSNTEYKKYLKTLNIGDELKVVVIRDGKEINCQARLIELNGEKIIGLYLVNLVNFEVDPKVKLNFKWNESGPSGGFMLSLALFDKLVDDDLTKGRKIVGTGTIDINGNIGEIGGIKYKLMGAVKNKANIFFVPTDNYEEAMKVKKQFNYKINIIKVDTLEDAVNYLKNN